MIILTEQKINELKQQLENNKNFQYFKKEDSLSFDDFDILDIDSKQSLHIGKKDMKGNLIKIMKLRKYLHVKKIS